MDRIKNFAKEHTIIYCIIVEILLLGGIIITGIPLGKLMNTTNIDSYVLQALTETVGVIVAFAALNVSGCADVLTNKGIGFFKGLLVGGYFLVIGVYSAIIYLVIYEGDRTLRPWYLIAVYLLCMLLVGIAEEWLFRGVHSELLLRRYGATKEGIWKAVIISGVLFGLAHLSNLFGAEPIGVLVQCVVAAAMGMVFAAIYFRTGNIWVTVFLHAFIDACALITSGLYEGTIADAISGYQPMQIIGVVPYMIVLLVLLRKKKLDQMLRRLSGETEYLPVDEI